VAKCVFFGTASFLDERFIIYDYVVSLYATNGRCNMDFTEILNNIGILLYRRSMTFYCKGCRKVIGELHQQSYRRDNWWGGCWCVCDNYDLWTSLDFEKIKGMKKTLLYHARFGDDGSERTREADCHGGGG